MTHNESRVADASHLSVGDTAVSVRLAGIRLKICCYCFYYCYYYSHVSEVVSVLAVVGLGALVGQPVLSGCKGIDGIVRISKRTNVTSITPFREVTENANCEFFMSSQPFLLFIKVSQNYRQHDLERMENSRGCMFPLLSVQPHSSMGMHVTWNPSIESLEANIYQYPIKIKIKEINLDIFSGQKNSPVPD